MSVRLLNKLVPHSVSLDSVGGGKADINACDVAAALGFGNLSGAACDFGFTKYCDDETSAYKLMDYFNAVVNKTALTEQWAQEIGDTRGLAQLMMLEGVYGVQCKKCKGVCSQVQCKENRLEVINCEKCNGTGLGMLSQRQRARIANIPSSSWDRHFRVFRGVHS